MSISTLQQIEAEINQLSTNDQLLLMERLARRIRSRQALAVRESDLASMADDPAIQQELREIEAEFAPTEADGLDATP